jgi:serralysin
MTLAKKISPYSIDETTFQDIDGVLSGWAWNTNLATTSLPIIHGAVTLTYSFPDSPSDYGKHYGINEQNSGFQALNATQIQAAEFTIQQYDSVISDSSLHFREVSPGAAADKDAIIRYAESNKPSTAWAYYPSELPEGGDVWLNNNRHNYDTPAPGNDAWDTFLHETGHAMGLKHPHEDVAGFGIVPLEHDSVEYSVMSYRSYVGGTIHGSYSNEEWGFPQTLMMDDIAAQQYMYGADFKSHGGNTTYHWDPATGQLAISENGGAWQFAPMPGADRVFMTVWDGNGADTYDFSSYTTNLAIDLQPGHWTQTDTSGNYQTAHLDFHENDTHLAAGNIANALLYYGDTRSLIENAIGGSGDDTFVGNQTGNMFTGGAGADSFTGGGGADIFDFSGAGGGIDHILDFNAGEGDKIAVHHAHYKMVATTNNWAEILFTSGDAVILNGIDYAAVQNNHPWIV